LSHPQINPPAQPELDGDAIAGPAERATVANAEPIATVIPAILRAVLPNVFMVPSACGRCERIPLVTE
jgi:hypothetical protein